MEHLTVYKGTETHSAFPSVIRLHSGELLAAFREAPVRGDPRQDQGWDKTGKRSHYHLDPGSQIVLVRSSDDGATWDPSSRTVVCPTVPERDLNYAMVSQLASGELLVSQHRWFVLGEDQKGRFDALTARRLICFPFGHPYAIFGGVVYDAMYLTRSVDEGRSWSRPEPIAIGPLAYFTHSGTRGAVQLPDGTLLLPFSGQCPADRSARAFVVRSTDGGRTWGHQTVVAWDPEGRISFAEPALERLPDGRLLMMLRTGGADGYLYQVFSDDDGWTWQGLQRTPIWGYPAHLLALKSGRVLCAYGYRREPLGVRACLSEDGGRTWDVGREKVLRQDGMHVDLGYPNSVQLLDGRILTVYYFHGADGIRYIGGTVYAEGE